MSELEEVYRAVKLRTQPVDVKDESGELIICDSCHFSFDVSETNCELCLTCLKVLRCMQFVADHRLCSCGDSWCVHNNKERRAKADKLNRLAAHQP